jgi:hypothetical protein
LTNTCESVRTDTLSFPCDTETARVAPDGGDSGETPAPQAVPPHLRLSSSPPPKRAASGHAAARKVAAGRYSARSIPSPSHLPLRRPAVRFLWWAADGADPSAQACICRPRCRIRAAQRYPASSRPSTLTSSSAVLAVSSSAPTPVSDVFRAAAGGSRPFGPGSAGPGLLGVAMADNPIASAAHHGCTLDGGNSVRRLLETLRGVVDVGPARLGVGTLVGWATRASSDVGGRGQNLRWASRGTSPGWRP